LVLDVVRKIKRHITADDIYHEIVRDYPNISRGTVYRNLNQLAKGNEIRKVEVPGGADCFESRCIDHYHVKCLNCGEIFDVEMEYIADLEKGIKDSHGIDFSGHDIMFKGICPKCKN
jgi:Fur family ferric uptake transcriptional regulator/Fur family peroxide stress response transcriptional regulator